MAITVNQADGGTRVTNDQAEKTSRREYSVPSVDRALKILHYLKNKKQAGVSEIAGALSITRSNCFSILKTLQRNNFVTFNEDTKKYMLGPAMLEFSRAILRETSVIHVARPFLTEFVRKNGLSAVLVQRISATRLLVIDREDSADDVRVVVSVGTRIPITHSATGRAALAYLPADETEMLVKTARVQMLTPDTMHEPADIMADLPKIRERGYAIALGENLPGVTAIAAPVFDSASAPVLVVTTLATSQSLSRATPEHFGAELRRAADQITEALGGVAPDRGTPPKGEVGVSPTAGLLIARSGHPS